MGRLLVVRGMSAQNAAQSLARPTDTRSASARPASSESKRQGGKTSAGASFRVTEKAWLATVLDAFRLHGWTPYHTHDSRRSAPGFPDVVAVHPGQGRILYCELKRVGGRLTHDQTIWLSRLAAAGAEVYLWTPDDWETALAAMRGGEA